MLHVGCGLIQGREKKEGKKKKKSKEKENGIVRTDRLSNMYIEPCLPTCFFFFTCIVKTLTNGCFFFFINKMYYDKTSCFPRSILFQLLSRPCNCYHPGII